MQGRIIGNKANLYTVEMQEKIYESTARGKLKQDEIKPAVGDIVDIDIIDEENKKAVIKEIHERKTYIKRPKIANITQIILLVSTVDPKPDLLMLDKQLAYSELLKIKPIIVINKIDLDDSYKKIEETYSKIGYEVITIAAKNNNNVEKLKEKLKNNINVFAGNSGVGKSTTINALFGKDMTQEGEISKKNKRGKNTTTDVCLYRIDEETYIADTPGFSTFELTEIDSEDLANYFKEFKAQIDECEFIGCTHIKEENCGIKNAVEDGKISKKRYERFCKIYAEIKEKEARKW